MKILICSPVDPEAIEQLRTRHEVDCQFHASPATLAARVRDCEAIVFRSGVQINREVLSQAPRLELLIRAGSGIDNLDVNYSQRRGIRLVRIQNPGARAVAEMAFGLMLVLARDLIRADRSVRTGMWAKEELLGHLLLGKTLGIVGCGNIGTMVGKLGAAWGMHPVGCVGTRSEDASRRLAAHGIEMAEFGEVIASADVVSIHVPLTEATRSLIDARALSRMKRGSFLINLSRGGVVDETVLLRELSEGQRIRGAALDVHENEGRGVQSPFSNFENVILTPHIGAMTVESQREIGLRVIEIVDSWEASPERNTGI